MIVWYDDPNPAHRRKSVTLDGGNIWTCKRRHAIDVWPPPQLVDQVGNYDAAQRIAFALGCHFNVGDPREPATLLHGRESRSEDRGGSQPALAVATAESGAQSGPDGAEPDREKLQVLVAPGTRAYGALSRVADQVRWSRREGERYLRQLDERRAELRQQSQRVEEERLLLVALLDPEKQAHYEDD